MIEPWISARGSRYITCPDTRMVRLLSKSGNDEMNPFLLTIPGLIGMQINLPNSGTFFFISDHCHVIENVCIQCPSPLHLD
jgi:hypothetical protein